MSEGEPVWGFRQPHHRYDPEPYAEGHLHRGYNHSPLGRNGAGEWITAVFEWEPGCNEVGGFTIGCVPHCVIAVRKVGEELARRFKGLELGPVDFWQHPRLAKVKRPRIPRVLLPYRGPPLCYLYVGKAVPLDLERSTVTVERNEAGEVTNVHSFRGWEKIETTGVMPNFTAVRVPRQPGMGLIYRASDVGDLDFWRIKEVNCLGHEQFYCRDRVKRFIEEAGYSNVKFYEVGEIVED